MNKLRHLIVLLPLLILFLKPSIVFAASVSDVVVTADSYTAGATTTWHVSFTLVTDLPATYPVYMTFPAGFDLSGVDVEYNPTPPGITGMSLTSGWHASTFLYQGQLLYGGTTVAGSLYSYDVATMNTSKDVSFDVVGVVNPSAGTYTSTDFVAFTHVDTGASPASNIVIEEGSISPTVSSPTSTSITATTATLGGNVTSDGGASVTERGVCVGASANPTTSGTCFTTSGTTGVFTVSATSLTPNTTYYYRAYATNSIGTSYSINDTFLTATTPTITSPTSTSITATTATLGGNVTSDGRDTITQRGVCVGASANPTTSGTCFTTPGTTGVFTVSATGLSGGTTYHYRAYAINSAGTSYTSDSTFGTLGSPVATTGAASSIGQTSTTLNGTITANSATTTVTFKYGTVADLSSGTTTITATGSPVASDGSNVAVTYALSGLSGATTYYFRVIAVNSEGTTNGDILSFTTDSAPTVTSPTSASITGTTATLGGNVTSDGGDTVTSRGVCVSISSNPTTSDTCFSTSGTTGVFTVSATNLFSSATYHYRAYATNSISTSYSSDDTFTTSARYWVGGTGNWSETAHWSTSSGGAGGASLPDSTQMAYFDANSFSTTGQTVTIDMNAVSGGMNWTGALYNPTLDIDTGHTITIGGSLTLIPNMAIDGDETNNVHIIEFAGSGSYTITMAGHSFPIVNLGSSASGITFGLSGTWSLLDDFDQRHSNVRFGGTFITNNHDINLRWAMRNGGALPSLYLGTSVFGLYDYWLLGGTNGFTVIEAENATLEIHPDADFAGMGWGTPPIHWKVIHAFPGILVGFTGWGYFSGSLSTDTLILEGDTARGWYPMPGSPATEGWLFGTDGLGAVSFIVGSLIVNGSENNLAKITGTLTTTAQISTDYLRLENSTCVGVTPCYAGSHSINDGGNSGWVFSAPPATATTVAASSLTTTTATLNGTANGKGDSAITSFIYGTVADLSSGTTTITASQSPVTGNSDSSVNYSLTGLIPGTTYYYRVSITNSYGTTEGDILSFTTTSLPSTSSSSNSSSDSSSSVAVESIRQALIVSGTAGGSVNAADNKANIVVEGNNDITNNLFFWLAPRTNADVLAGNSVAGKVSNIPPAVLNSSTSKIYELDPSNLSTGQHITTLSKPIIMTLEVNSLRNVQIYFYDTVTKNWSLLNVPIVTNSINNTASFVTSKAGLYVAVNGTNNNQVATSETPEQQNDLTTQPSPTPTPQAKKDTKKSPDFGLEIMNAIKSGNIFAKTVSDNTAKIGANITNTFITTFANIPFKFDFSPKNPFPVLGASTVNFGQLIATETSSRIKGLLGTLSDILTPEPTKIYGVRVIESTPTSMTVAWKTNQPANSKVNYGETLDFGQDVQSEEKLTDHKLTITGLKPNTTYVYEVMSHGKTYVYDAHHTFTTPE